MSLSIACHTNHPGPQVTALLTQLRGVADEIFLAVDSRVDTDSLGEYVVATDHLVRYEFVGTERSLPWLHGQCSSDWILLIDGDEVVAPTLIDLLRDLTRKADVLQYRIPTRWLHPDPDHWLNEVPWYPDYHNRLVRNDATLCFPDQVSPHAAHASRVFPARYLEEPIYHLDTAVTTYEARQEKVAIYEAESPGMIAPGGGPINASYYLPEQYARLEPIPVPSEDRAAISEVVSAKPSGAAPPPLESVHLATREEIDSYWPGRALPSTAYAATITPLERDTRFYPGEHRELSVRITNEGDARWPSQGQPGPQIRATYRLKNRDGSLVVPHGLRTGFPAPVEALESCVVPVLIEAPDQIGDYILEFDLVHEGTDGFRCPSPLPIRVTPSPRGPAS